MYTEEIITVTDNLVTLYITPDFQEEIQDIIKTNSLDMEHVPEGFIAFNHNKDIIDIDITLKSTAHTGEIEILESPINPLWGEKSTVIGAQSKELSANANINENLEENSPIIEESTTSTFSWLFNLPYIGVKKIFNPIKDFILSFFWSSSSPEEIENPTQVLNSGRNTSKGTIDELNRILEEALPNATVINNHQHLSSIKGKEEYKAPEIFKREVFVHIDVIIKLYNSFVEQQENALAKISKNSTAVPPLSAEDLRMKEKIDEIMSIKPANKKDAEAFKKTEVFVPSNDVIILSPESNLNSAEQQLPVKEDKGQSSSSPVVKEDKGQSSGSNDYIKTDKPNGVFIELPYNNKSRDRLYQSYNTAILEEAKNLIVKNDIIKGLNDGVKLTDTQLNGLLHCVGRQLSTDPKVQGDVDFFLTVHTLKTYIMARTNPLGKNPLNKMPPLSICEIVELMNQFTDKEANTYFPKIDRIRAEVLNRSHKLFRSSLSEAIARKDDLVEVIPKKRGRKGL